MSSTPVKGFWESLVRSVLYTYLTGLVVLLGYLFGTGFLSRGAVKGHMFGDTEEGYTNWDGQWFTAISRHGYWYSQESQSNVAFFPAYPLAGRAIARVTGLRHDGALLLVSNAFLLLLFYLTDRYVADRYPDSPAELADSVLLAMGLTPTSFFFRMVYSEAMFMAVTMLALHAMVRTRPPLVVAILVGLATAIRPVGVGLLPALVFYTWRHSKTVKGFVARLIGAVPLGCWGIAAYMGYQYASFGDSLAFVHTQQNWAIRSSPGLWEKVHALVTLEPIRSLYDPSGPGYWAKLSSDVDPLFSLRAADPVYFLGTAVLIAAGAARRWLSVEEVLTAACLLLIPYVTNGYEQYVQSIARYSAAAVPVYLVLGHLLCRLPAPFVTGTAGVSGMLLGIYTAMYASWHFFI